jgi:hypothetical protein
MVCRLGFASALEPKETQLFKFDSMERESAGLGKRNPEIFIFCDRHVSSGIAAELPQV